MAAKLLIVPILCTSLFWSFSYAQDCAPPIVTANAKSVNLFSPEQEMIFGELALQSRAAGTRFIDDQKLISYLSGIGNRLTKHLPPSGLRFQFHLIDIPDANAFNIPGGHVIVSRKLAVLVNNEDELAGVIAHELGHAVVHHGAVDISESLRKILNITALGDRKDITEKYNLLIERARTKQISRKRNHEDEKQLEADRIGLFAMVAAGYDPAAFFSFFDRLTESDGKTGSWLSNLFGTIRPNEKRLREMVQTIEQLPPSCREGRGAARAREVFLKWQAETVSFRETVRDEKLPGLVWKKALAPKLRSDVSHFAFSGDGKLLLAQDDFAITVIQREPLQVLFQIPVDSANEAMFSPDGQFIVFITDNLRYEKWSVAEKGPVEMRELVLRRDCWEQKLSPDGNYLACVDTSTNVNIVDTRIGKKVWEKKEFYQLSFLEYLSWLSRRERDSDQTSFFRIEFSPDSRFVMFSRSEKFRFRVTVDHLTVGGSENTALALDLTTLKPAEVGGKLKELSSRSYIFLDSERILGMPAKRPDESGVFSFPSGKRLQKFDLAALDIKRTSNPDYVVIKPLANAQMGLFDLKKGAIASGLQKKDAALWSNIIAYEGASGGILLREVSYNEAEKRIDIKGSSSVEIPVASIRNLEAAAVSDNFKWLLLSSKTRGALWNLETGERKLYVRGFRGALVDNDGVGVGDFPKLDDANHGLVLLNPHNKTTEIVRDLPEKGARQFGRFVLLRRSLNQKEEKKGELVQLPGEDPDNRGLDQNVRFELKDFIQDKVIWSRDFVKGAPEFSFDEFSGRLSFYWRLDREEGKAKLKDSIELNAKADALGNKAGDYLVEIVDAFAQTTVGFVLVDSGNGSFDVGEGVSERNWLVLRDSRGRVLVYSIRDGDLKYRFFGQNAAINPKRNQIAVENLPGEVTLYSLDSGEPQGDVLINSSAVMLRFTSDGNKLFLLTGTQSIYAFDVDRVTGVRSGQTR